VIEIFNPVFNYLDPGTGSYLYQIIIAAGITVGIYIRSLRAYGRNVFYRIKKLFSSK
tara:strand:+ start:74 stop:244 length:171 start_codon:yes stop_codon:yes gene_type:complete